MNFTCAKEIKSRRLSSQSFPQRGEDQGERKNGKSAGAQKWRLLWRRSSALFVQLPILLSIGVLVGCKPESKTAPPKALAEVNGRAVTEETFRYWWNKEAPASDSPENRRALLNQLVQRSTLAQKALAVGLDHEPEMVEAIESLLIARLKEKELQPRIEAIKISDEEAFTFYQNHRKERYAEPERARAAVLWFETRGQEPLVARYRPRLEKARAEIISQKGTFPVSQGFGPLAMENSEHSASRYKGGDVGWIEFSNQNAAWMKAVAEITAKLTQPGEVSDVVIRDEGLFVVRLIEHRPAQFREFASVRGEIIRLLRNEKRSSIEKEFFAELEPGSVVRQHPERLAALSALPTQPTTAPSLKPTQVTLHTKP